MDIFSSQPINTKNGISVFTEADFYWSIAPREEMEAFVSLAREKGYKVAQQEYMFSSRFDYAEDFGRADFHFLLPLSKDAVVLDLGSGYGNVTIPLAKHYKKVVAADASLPLLEYSKVRADSEGCTNIEYVQIDPLEKANLPFRAKSFDVVIMNGVLEWVGPGDLSKTPTELQVELLKRISNLLKDGGILYIGIENRMFPGWLRRDPHSKLKWTSLLPRFLADKYARAHGFSEGYRTYIYSSWGYRKLLSQADFVAGEMYYPYTSYRDLVYIYGTQKNIVQFVFRNYLSNIYTKKWSIFLKVAKIFHLENFFLSSFIIIAQKSKHDLGAPFLIHEARKKYPDFIREGDRLMKIKGEGQSSQYAHFSVFHEMDSAPYAELKVLRDPDSAGEALALTVLK